MRLNSVGFSAVAKGNVNVNTSVKSLNTTYYSVGNEVAATFDTIKPLDIVQIPKNNLDNTNLAGRYICLDRNPNNKMVKVVPFDKCSFLGADDLEKLGTKKIGQVNVWLGDA